METEPVRKNKKSKRGVLKAAILALFIGAAIITVRFTPLKEVLTPDHISALMETAGAWAPVVYILFYAIGACLFIPGTMLAVIGAAVFGPYLGFVYVWLGAILGASGAFLIGRYLGRDFAASLIGPRLQKYDEAIGRNGFATVLYLRLIYFPFTPLNFGMGLTKVRFREYFSGTALGIMVGTFIFTFFVGTIQEVWAGGRWEELLSWKVVLSLALFLFSFFIPKLLKLIKISKETGTV